MIASPCLDTRRDEAAPHPYATPRLELPAGHDDRGLMTDGKHQAGINTINQQQQLQGRPKLWAFSLFAIRPDYRTKIQVQIQIPQKIPLGGMR